ncbi:MAG: tetratricopeptide repeat protein [Algicola sp.]|nr:tetratricopeptide repeat protein [Algicola sp.]
MKLKYIALFSLLFLSITSNSQNSGKDGYEAYYKLDELTRKYNDYMNNQPTSIYINCDDENSIQKGISNRNDKIRYMSTPSIISLCQEISELKNSINPNDVNPCDGRTGQIESIKEEINKARSCLDRLKNETNNTTSYKSSSIETTSNNQNNNTYNDQSESIYQIRRRQAQQYQNARDAQIQRQVEANQRQYQQTMDNNARAKNYINSIFNNTNSNSSITRYVDNSLVSKNYNSTGYDDSPKYVENPSEEAKRRYANLKIHLGLALTMHRYKDFREKVKKIKQEKYFSTLNTSEKKTLRLYEAIANIGDPDFIDSTLLKIEFNVYEESNYLVDKDTKRNLGLLAERIYQRGYNANTNKDYNLAAVEFQKVATLVNAPYFLTFSAIAYQDANNFNKSIDIFQQLIKLDKDLSFTFYYLEDRKSGNEEGYFDKETFQSDFQQKNYINPRQKNEVITQEQLLNKLIEIYYNIGETEKAKNLLENSIKSVPKDFEALFNLGVMNAESGNFEAAIENYKEAIEINPNSFNVLLNISATILSKENQIVKQMNALGNTEADDLEYKRLGKQRTQVYKDAIMYLEKAHALRPNHIEIVRTLMNIYENLSMDDKFKKMKIKLAKIRS